MTALVLDHRASNRTWDRFVLPGVILALGLWTALAAGYRVITLPDGNQTADYLINWEGGPVRRGALGSLLLVLPVDGVSLLWVVAALQVGLLLALYGAVAYLAASYAPSWNLAILVLSPAFLLFPVLNPAESARKELFGLVALALLGISVRRRIWGWLPWVAIGTFTIGVWAHEVNVLLLPSVLALGVIAARRGLVTKSWAVAWGIVVASIALSALVFSLIFPADSRISAELCRSLINRGLTADYCGGAVTLLAMSPLDALRWVVTWYPAYFLYIPLGAMALLAVYLWAPQRWTWWLFAVQWGALIPLFIFAIDYGRWIYVGISAVTLVILATGRSSASRQPRVPWPFALAYVSFWSLPAVTPVVQDPLLTRMIGHAFLQALPWVNRVL